MRRSMSVQLIDSPGGFADPPGGRSAKDSGALGLFRLRPSA
jgi:hypothetical protein